MGRMRSSPRPDVRRRRQMVRLRLQGFTLREIGRRLGVTYQTVAYHLRKSGHAPPLACAGCGAALANRGGPLARPVYCTSCLRARLEVPFGVRLRSLRLAAGLSQQELAQRAGLTVNTVRVHEAGIGALRAATVERLAQVLGQRLLESER